jgi:PAP2 superfamily protein
MMTRVEAKRRIGVVGLLLVLYLCAVVLGAVSLPGYRNATGLRDLGHYYVPSLLVLIGEKRAEYAWWLGTLPLELAFGVVAASILITGAGVRLGMCLYSMYVLHWLFLHATTLPPPDHIVWRFPPGVLTFAKPEASDFWFSGHVANAFVIALATKRSQPWIRGVAWGFVPFQILLVLSARTHYSIDVLGGLFVAYATHRVSLDLAAAAGQRWRSTGRCSPSSTSPSPTSA